MAVMSRWSGGLIDRFGARLPLIVGPAIAAIGFALLALLSNAHTIGLMVLPLVVLGVGMAVTVAPLTTTVISSVPERQTGVASGINNAVASLASLLAIAIFGAVALGAHNAGLDRRLSTQAMSTETRQAVSQAHGKFVIEVSGLQGDDRETAKTIIRQSLRRSIALVMWLAAALACAAAVCAALTIRPTRKKPEPALKPAPA
jgi:MFS family permease